jgi:uncharacterized protein
VGPYYTRPMSEGWSQLSDIDRLADGHADVDFEIPLDVLPRLQAKLAGTRGSVHGVAHFSRAAGLPIAQLDIEGVAELVCQRCLAPMRWPVQSSSRVALIPSEQQADRVPDDLEPVLAEGDRLRLRDLVEEELLLSLPIVPLHADPKDCGAGVKRVLDEKRAATPTTQKPFERLGELLKRNE